jgi:hypothetical protein
MTKEEKQVQLFFKEKYFSIDLDPELIAAIVEFTDFKKQLDASNLSNESKPLDVEGLKLLKELRGYTSVSDIHLLINRYLDKNPVVSPLVNTEELKVQFLHNCRYVSDLDKEACWNFFLPHLQPKQPVVNTLPTDEEIETERYKTVDKRCVDPINHSGFIEGAKWMRDNYLLQPQQGEDTKLEWVSVEAVDKLNPGDIFLWKSGMNGNYEIHQFHSDAGYGAKTFTNYNEKDGSSTLVNYLGICGILVPKSPTI